MRARPRELPAASRPRVSAVIPLYNYGRYLAECVESLVTQEGVDVDITIVDDASTDDSLEIAEALSRRHPAVRVRSRERNLGHIATFNEALASATAPYVVKMDPDDVLPPGSLRRSVGLMEAYPDTAFVYGYAAEFAGTVPVAARAAVRSWSVWSGREWMWRRARSGHNVIRQPEVVIRRSALEQVGGHRPQVPAASDLNLWLRLTTVGSVGRVNGPVQGFYRMHAESMQRTMYTGFFADLTARVGAFQLFVDECSDSLDDPAALRATIDRTLARDAVRMVQRHRDGSIHLAEPIREYLDLAASLDPGVVGTRAWAAVDPERPAGGRGAAAARAAGAAWRDVVDRGRWRYSRRYGL